MKTLNCIAINPPWLNESIYCFPLGLATIVSVVKQQGHNVEVIDFDASKEEDIKSVLERSLFIPDVVLLTGMVTNYTTIRNLAEAIKLVWSDTVLIIGGGLASATPMPILKKVSADVFFVGEGEERIKLCLEAISLGKSLESIPGLKLRKDKDNILTTEGEILPPDITRTPRPCYESFSTESYVDFLKRIGYGFEIYASKGCPFSCKFCYRVAGKKVRHRLVDDVISEIKFIKDTYSINRFSFMDDCFALNKEWVYEFCAKVRKLGIRFRIQTSVKMISEEILEEMLSAGFFGVSMGIESGSPSILRELNKPFSLPRAEKFIEWFRSHGIQYNATFIVGNFGENEKSIEMTKRFLIRNGFNNNFKVSFLTPYPGTELWREVLARGIIKNEEEYIENLTTLDKLQVNLTNYPSEKVIGWREDILKVGKS